MSSSCSLVRSAPHRSSVLIICNYITLVASIVHGNSSTRDLMRHFRYTYPLELILAIVFYIYGKNGRATDSSERPAASGRPGTTPPGHQGITATSTSHHGHQPRPAARPHTCGRRASRRGVALRPPLTLPCPALTTSPDSSRWVAAGAYRRRPPRRRRRRGGWRPSSSRPPPPHSLPPPHSRRLHS
jgi:hypothetical protein